MNYTIIRQGFRLTKRKKTDMEKISDKKQEEKEFVPIAETEPDSNPEEDESKESVFGTRQKKLVLISLSLVWFTVNCADSMISPFFPGEALKKGCSTTITGLVFAVFPFVIFIFSPVVGIVLPMVGPKFTLMCGLFVEGAYQIMFGFVDMMNDENTFIIFSFLIRIVSALGSAATSTASITLVVQYFHDDISPAIGVLETFAGFGMTAGPAIGGFLYSAGGFKLPFIVLGAVVLVGILPILWILPPDTEVSEDEKNKGALWQALKIPSIIILSIVIVNAAMALSFLDPTLQGHIQKPFHLKSYQVGLMFLITPGIYAFMAPLVGCITDKMDARMLMILGGTICGLSCVLLGPAPILPETIFPRTLWMNGIALALLGFGVGLFLVPTLSDMTHAAVKHGMAEDLSTHSAISSIFNAFFNIGLIAGPTAGSGLAQNIGFPWAGATIGFFFWFWTSILVIFTIIERGFKSISDLENSEDSKPLMAKL